MAIDPSIKKVNVGQELQSGVVGIADWAGVFPTEYFQNQADELWDDGVRHVAFAAPGLNSSFVQSTVIPLQLQAIEIFLAKGFDVDWGSIPAGGSSFLKIDQWLNQYGLEDHLAAFQTLVTTYGSTGSRWILGNENEATWNINQSYTVPTFVRASNIATVTCTDRHNLAVGDRLTVNGIYDTVIEIVDEYIFKQTNTGSDITSSNVIVHLDTTTIARIMSRAAQYLKGLSGITLPVVYRCAQGSPNSGLNYYFEFMNNGVGYPNGDYLSSIDYLTVNVYGEGSSDAARLADFKAHIDKIATLFSGDISRTGITEIGLKENDSLDAATIGDLETYYNYWKERIDYVLAQTGLQIFIFAHSFPLGSNRNHLNMTQPVRYSSTEVERQPIYNYFLESSVDSEMLLPYTVPSGEMQFDLVRKTYYTTTIAPTESGYLTCPTSGGDARRLVSDYNFNKTKNYGWMFWYQAEDITNHPINTLIRFGDGSGQNGYRLLLERDTNTNVVYLKIQDFKTFDTYSVAIPNDIDPEDWNHICFSWEGSDSLADKISSYNWRPVIYINGRRLVAVGTSLNFNSFTTKSSGSIFIGHDFDQQNLGGKMVDLAFFYEKIIYPNDIWKAIKYRQFPRASSYWPLIGTGAQAADLLNGQHLTLSGNSTLYQVPVDFSYEPWADIFKINGYLQMNGEDGGYARKLVSKYHFAKNGAYAIGFLCRMRDMDEHAVNTIFRFGDLGTNGYRILMQRELGIDYLTLQNGDDFSLEKIPLTSNFDPHSWFHVLITWDGDGTGWDADFYINGHLLVARTSALIFSDMVEKLNGTIYVGTDYNVENMDGDIARLMFWENKLTQFEVTDLINNLNANNLASYWPLNETVGPTAADSISDQELTISTPSYLVNKNGKIGKWYQKQPTDWHS